MSWVFEVHVQPRSHYQSDSCWVYSLYRGHPRWVHECIVRCWPLGLVVIFVTLYSTILYHQRSRPPFSSSQQHNHQAQCAHQCTKTKKITLDGVVHAGIETAAWQPAVSPDVCSVEIDVSEALLNNRYRKSLLLRGTIVNTWYDLWYT